MKKHFHVLIVLDQFWVSRATVRSTQCFSILKNQHHAVSRVYADIFVSTNSRESRISSGQVCHSGVSFRPCLLFDCECSLTVIMTERGKQALLFPQSKQQLCEKIFFILKKRTPLRESIFENCTSTCWTNTCFSWTRFRWNKNFDSLDLHGSVCGVSPLHCEGSPSRDRQSVDMVFVGSTVHLPYPWLPEEVLSCHPHKNQDPCIVFL